MIFDHLVSFHNPNSPLQFFKLLVLFLFMLANMSESEVKQKVNVEVEQDEDPGIVFIFENEDMVHNCMQLPSVATVAGEWGEHCTRLANPQAGRKNFLKLCVFTYVLRCNGSTI